MEKSRSKSHSSHFPTEDSKQTNASHQGSRSKSHPSESRRSTRPSRHRSHSRSCHSTGEDTGKIVIDLTIPVHEHVNILQEDILPADLRMSRLQTC